MNPKIMKNNQFFTKNILEWGAKHLRSFPWRKNITPYSALICEIFLQQTQASSVNKVFPKFLKKYPDVRAFVNFDENELVDIIKPLGLYNKRLKYFKDIRTELENKFSYKIPENFDDLSSLSGVDIYNANAILCFAFNKRVPIVDTNVKRTFQRYFNYNSEKKDLRDDKKIWILAERSLPSVNYKNYNYSLLDFGGLICKKSKPKCLECLLSVKCMYYREKLEN